MPHGDKAKRILAAAERLFASRRYHEVTLDEVAKAALVAKGTIYLYFRDKEDLFVQAATSGFDEVCELLEHHVPTEAPFEQQLRSACQEITRFQQRRRPLWRMMHSEEGRGRARKRELFERWAARRGKLVSALGGILRRGIDSGAIRNDLTPEAMAFYLLSLLRTRERMLEHLPDEQQGLDVLLDLFLSGTRRHSR